MNRTSSSTWVKGVADMFASQGIDVPKLFRTAKLDIQLLDKPEARFDVEKISELWELAVAWSGNPALGMNPELTSRYVNFDIVGHAMLSSPDLRCGLDNLSRYMALISDCTTFELQSEGQNSWLVLGHIGNTRRLPRQRQEYSLLTLLSLCSWVTRRDIRVLGAEFIFPEPINLESYRQAFDCPLKFDQAASRFLLAAEDLDAPIPSRNRLMFELHERVIEERLSSLGNTRTSYRVSEEIMRKLHQGEPRREDIASDLALTDRTLQRRLQAENTSFQQLLDEARRELARKYLTEDRHSLGQVADKLGFVDQSNFFRACKRWFGLPPGQYRQRLGMGRPSAA
ncbi:AraC family transcriptional regulator [Polaromonas sp. SM01]|uniref:AraC family transcriptional regulator n=1 Tax=Polaromonas sp. SM01 TaxID=3085630 RepID=UPI002980FF38|nr:AraC family transcriptional regulator [Polaromonas sp. SM01]MDW5444440.1 AraC family transcriptional regulator [Polaromonas sp. SM01]